MVDGDVEEELLPRVLLPLNQKWGVGGVPLPQLLDG